MLEILKTLKETPLPIVLVIGGLIFLLIPFIQKIQAKEVGVETTNQLGAGIIGFVLLVIGIGLYIIPSGTAASTLPTAIPPMVESTSKAIQPTTIVQPLATLTNLPSVPIQPTIASSSSLCPDYVSRSKVESWSIGATDVATVDDKAREFNASRSYPRGNFKAGDKIPAGVVVATAFDGAGRKWSEFPVTPLVHHGDYGLFETLGEYIAPYEGACISIAP